MKMFLNRHGVHNIEEYYFDQVKSMVEIIIKEQQESENKVKGKEIITLTRNIENMENTD